MLVMFLLQQLYPIYSITLHHILLCILPLLPPLFIISLTLSLNVVKIRVWFC